MRLTFTVEHSHVDGERSYTSIVDLNDKAGIEIIEAHARTMIKILADQATKDCESDDEDEDDWKKVNT
jgi:hypothetical protein